MSSKGITLARSRQQDDEEQDDFFCMSFIDITQYKFYAVYKYVCGDWNWHCS